VILHPAKDATPCDAVTGFAVQLSTAPLPGWEVMARVTALVFPVATFPLASSTETAGWADQAVPLAPPPGWVVKTSFVAAPAVMLNVLLVAEVRFLAVALSV
jgi:hypothetical protein